VVQGSGGAIVVAAHGYNDMPPQQHLPTPTPLAYLILARPSCDSATADAQCHGHWELYVSAPFLRVGPATLVDFDLRRVGPTWHGEGMQHHTASKCSKACGLWLVACGLARKSQHCV
jgi:hypothetical protein